MKTLIDLQNDHREFVVAMGWDNSKTPLESVALIHEEVAELGHELRQWKTDENAVSDELADVILRVIDLSAELGINIQKAVEFKITHNLANIEHHKAKGRRI